MSGTADRAAHLAMIQGVITRMASNSFQLKTLSVTFAAAVIAYLGAVPAASVIVVAGGVIAMLIFWALDARYLRLERLYRKLYDQVRTSAVGADYSMSVADFEMEVPSSLRIGLTWSVLWVHAGLVLALVIVAATRPAAAPTAAPSVLPGAPPAGKTG